MGNLTHQDIGQMQMYVNYYTRELMNEGDNPPIGILLGALSKAVVGALTFVWWALLQDCGFALAVVWFRFCKVCGLYEKCHSTFFV